MLEPIIEQKRPFDPITPPTTETTKTTIITANAIKRFRLADFKFSRITAGAFPKAAGIPLTYSRSFRATRNGSALDLGEESVCVKVVCNSSAL
ncbi:unnamed protein product [Periconia digitata]|uniref:Uncharacterized protein n=1 Tax=Periconia digitata TaxID=1303443 RepID=A0A9W4UH85_9PLEO|nr:unnamed protein product [Periconia digitata]